MKKSSNAFEKGRGAFFNGLGRKPTDDIRFVEIYLAGKSKENKLAHIAEWKAGWDDAKLESETKVEEPVAKKKTKKKAKRKAKK